MAVYMIDYENVKTGGLNGISRLTDADRVIIFYSENANRLTFDLHQRLMASTAKIEYREVSVGGHNALDFQLVTYLGFLIAQEPDGQYLIISNDRGFEYVVNFWRKDGLSIGLLPYLKDPNYALQKALRPDGKPAASPVIPEEPAEEPSPEPEVIFEAAEEAAPEEATPETAIPEEPAPEVVFADAAAAEAAPAEPAEAPQESAEKPKPSRKKKPSAPKKQEKQAEKPSAKPVQAKEEPQKPADKVEETEEPTKPAETLSAETRAELRAMLGDSVADDPELRFVLGCVEKYKTKLGLNNALVKRFGNQKASEIYQKLKPLLSAKKTVAPAPKQKNASKPKKEKAAVS
ncbi:MAG: hypothetical protein J1E00_07375 [Oscillospiraceae bacterium]|nr:hypothetical protein [Oscillospiraceae bacterium]